MMRYLGFLVLLLGMFGLMRAAPNSNHDLTTTLLDRCLKIFHRPCPTVTTPSPSPSPSPSPNPSPSRSLFESNESECVCVPHYQCTTDGVINTSGSTIIIGRFNTGTLEECDREDYRCCRRPDINNMTLEPTPMQSWSSVTVSCGHRNRDGIGMQISTTGNQTQFAEFPWMVAVLQNVSDSTARNIYKCGGSLIHPRAVLTAAHNIQRFPIRPTNLFVRAGDWDMKSLTEPIQHQERQVETIILHENFDSGNLWNDAAILILKTAFDMAPNVNAICLPQETDVFDGTRCIATGWGKDKAGRGSRFQSILKKIVLPVMPHDLCETRLRTTYLGSFFILDRSFICAGGEPNQDTCSGDGGSPLVCPMRDAPNRYVQAGIVSWGIGCGQDQLPGVYASVSKLRSWINSTLAGNGL